MESLFLASGVSNPLFPIYLNLVRGYSKVRLSDLELEFYNLDSSFPIHIRLENEEKRDLRITLFEQNQDNVSLKTDEAKILSNVENIEAGRFSNFMDIEVDFTGCLNLNNGGTSTMQSLKGQDGDGAGKKLGALTGISVDNSGRVYGSYDNGNTKLLGQIAVAQFSNASGLAKVGESCYQTTLNSGDFDGIGVEVSADGSSMTTGELEMSNVDLSTEFTQMITTQRGFQANSRVITTSDTLLEELVNLKR